MKKEQKESSDNDKEPEEKINELTETLKRVHAEFENYKKRVEKEKKEFMEYSEACFVAKLLPVIDSIDAAKKQLNEKELRGVELIQKQLMDLLQKEGLKEIKAEGERFDPLFHEALMHGKDEEKKEGTVLEELHKGYLFRDRVLRCAKVKINKLCEKEEGEKSEEGKKGREEKGH